MPDNLRIDFPPPDPLDQPVHALMSGDICVSVFLDNGTRLQGWIVAFDRDQLILRDRARPDQVVYRRKVSTIVPAESGGPVRFC